MRAFESYKAPGPDGFRPIVLKNLNEDTIKFVTVLYKLSIRRRYIPKQWRKMNVVFIPKPGKDDYSLPKSYRPITLSCFIFKGLERVILWYLRDYVIKDKLISQP